MRVLIADDLEAIRRQVSLIVRSRPDLEVCAEASNGQEAVDKTRDTNPDLIIMDITMPIMNGLDAVRRIRALAPETPIVILTVHKSRQVIAEAKKIGVLGYVSKENARQFLLEALDSVIRKVPFFPPES